MQYANYTIILSSFYTYYTTFFCSGEVMIRYKINVLKALKDKGYNTNYIRQNKIYNEPQLQQFRDNKLVTQDILDRTCKLLDCQPGDLLEYVPDNIPDQETETERQQD